MARQSGGKEKPPDTRRETGRSSLVGFRPVSLKLLTTCKRLHQSWLVRQMIMKSVSPSANQANQSAPRRTTPTTIREKIDIHSPELWQAIEKLLSLPPQQMLAAIIKLVLLDRVTDEELYRICNLYHTSLMLNLAGWIVRK